MATIINDTKDEKIAPKSCRDDYEPLESLEQLGLVHDKGDTLSPVDTLFNAREIAPRPKREPREVL